MRPLFWCRNCESEPVIEKPWTAIHPAGNQRFDTWREAYDYARTPMILMNYG